MKLSTAIRRVRDVFLYKLYPLSRSQLCRILTEVEVSFRAVDWGQRDPFPSQWFSGLCGRRRFEPSGCAAGAALEDEGLKLLGSLSKRRPLEWKYY